MKRMLGFTLTALGVLCVHRIASVPVVQGAGSAAFRAVHSCISTLPADDSGSDDSGDDDSGSEDAE